MSWQDDIKSFIKSSEFHSPTRDAMEYYLKLYFHISLNFWACSLHSDPLIFMPRDGLNLVAPLSYEFMYAKDSYILLFPNEGVRIHANKSFLEKIAITRQLLSDKWKEKPVVLKLYDPYLKMEVTGPTLIVSELGMDMFVYDKIPEDEQQHYRIFSNENNDGEEAADIRYRTTYFDQDNLLQSVRYALA